MGWPHDQKESNARLLATVEQTARSGLGALLRFVQLRTTVADEWRLAAGRIDVALTQDLRHPEELELKLARSRVEIVDAAALLRRLRSSLDGEPFPCRDLQLDAGALADLRNHRWFRSDECDFAEGWPGFFLSKDLASRFPEPLGAFIDPRGGRSWNSADDFIRDALGFQRYKGSIASGDDGRLRRVTLIVRDYRARIVGVTFGPERRSVTVQLEGSRLSECIAELSTQPGSDWVPQASRQAAETIDFPLDPPTGYVRVRVIDDPDFVDVRLVEDSTAPELEYDRFEDVDPGLGVLGGRVQQPEHRPGTSRVSATVNPIHFEDFSGEQFERLAFAYHLRAGRWKSLEWYGQVGSDLGRDILGVEERNRDGQERVVCIQCVNRERLTLAKARRDLDNAVRALTRDCEGNIRVFRFVCRSPVSAKMRDKIRLHAVGLGIAQCDVWSGNEFEERLRAEAESLLRRFVEGVAFPDSSGDLQAFVRDSVPRGKPNSVPRAPLRPPSASGPGVRDAFLGLRGPSPFPTAEEFFAAWRDRSRVFHHAWALVGREDTLQRLSEFISDRTSRVALVVGAGGSGKTKLLDAFVSGLATRSQIRFVEDGVPITLESDGYLDADIPLLVVDDAHRRDDLATVLALLQRRPATKLLLASRPAGAGAVRAQLQRRPLGAADPVILPDLGPLRAAAAKDLARQVLGPELDQYAERLTELSRDSPFIAVVGGTLLRTRRLAPEFLGSDETFRTEVLRHFEDVVLGQLGPGLPPDRCQNVLTVVAAVGPIDPSDDRIIRSASEFCGLRSSELRATLDALEGAGVLARKNRALRITPDVLSDFVLRGRCVGASGQSTGYIGELFEAFSEVALIPMLRNLAELDWQMSVGERVELEELDGIWRHLLEQFRAADALGRMRLAQSLTDVAFFQPERALEMVELAIAQPAASSAGLAEVTQSNVLRQLPRLLLAVAHRLESAPRACELLWQLSADPAGEDAALKQLQEFAARLPQKRRRCQEVIVDLVERALLAEPHRGRQALDVLEPVLAKAGMTTTMDEERLTMNSFVWQAPDAMHERALACLERAAMSGEIDRRLVAVRLLAEAQGAPRGQLGQTVEPAIRDAWLDFRRRALATLDRLARETTDSVGHLALLRGLRWHARYGDPAFRQDVARTMAAVPQSFDLDLTLACASSYHHPFDGPNGALGHEQWTRRLAEIAASFLHRHADPASSHPVLEGRLQALRAAKLVDPRGFLFALAEADAGHAAGLCREVLRVPQGELAGHVDCLLSAVRRGEPEKAEELIDAASISASTACAVAQGFGHWGPPFTARELDVWRRLLAHTDASTRTVALRSLRALAAVAPRVTASLLLEARTEDLPGIASDLCSVIDAPTGPVWSELSDAEVERVLVMLSACKDLEGSAVGEFLRASVRRLPRRTLEMMRERLQRARTMPLGQIEPIPYDGLDGALALGAVRVGEEMLDELLELLDDPADRDACRLFAEAAGDLDAFCVPVLEDWIESEDRTRILAVAHAFTGASPGRVTALASTVAMLLDAAFEAGASCGALALQALREAALAGPRGGPVGKPFPEDIALRDGARIALEQVASGTRAASFYNSLLVEAEKRIADR